MQIVAMGSGNLLRISYLKDKLLTICLPQNPKFEVCPIAEG